MTSLKSKTDHLPDHCRSLILLSWHAILLATTILAAPATARQAQDDSPRELSGMSASMSFNTKDDLPLDPQSETAMSMLYRLQKASPASLDRFAAYSRDVSLVEARDETIDYRFWLFRFPANLHKIQRIAIPDAPQTSDSIQHLYRCSASATGPSGNSISCTILTRSVPKKLSEQAGINTPIQVTGLLYCRALIDGPVETESADQSTLVFIADRLAWYPTSETIADKQMIALASLGFDVGQLDQIKSRNGKPLGTQDGDVFFQMLSAVATKTDSPSARPPAVPIKSIIAKSADNIGARVTLTARCRDCTRVNVIDPDKRQRYGIDHYYQLILFPDLNQSIVLREATDDGPAKAVYKRFPVTVCAIELPDGLRANEIQGNAISIDGTFFRIWKYDAEINQQANVSGTISPLIISRDFEIIATSFLFHRLLSWGIGIVAICAAFMYAYHRVFGKRHPRPSESILDSLPEQIDLTGIE